MEETGTAPTPAAAPDRLAALAAALGEPVRSAANAPVNFNDPALAWFVEEGAIDVFLVEQSGERVLSGLKHLLRASAGRLLFSFPADESAGEAAMVAVGKGLPGCKLRRLTVDALLRSGAVDEVARQVDEWLHEVLAALAAGVEDHPLPDRRVAPGDAPTVEAGALVAAKSGAAWVRAEDGVALLGAEPADPDGPGLLPVTPESWVAAAADGPLEAVSSRTLCDDGRLEAVLASFHRVAGHFEHMTQRLLLADQANLQRSRIAHREQAVDDARRGLFELLTGLPPGASPLSLALDLVGRHEGIAFKAPPGADEADQEPAVRSVAAASGVRCRDLKLNNASQWWRGDSGAMLAFTRDGGAPVALLPGARGYRMVDPLSGRSTHVDRAAAQRINRIAWSFVRPLPHEHAIGAGDLARCASGSLRGDLIRFMAAGVVCGLFAVLPAIVLAFVAESVLPYGDTTGLLRFTGVLVALSAAAAVLTMFQGTALMRLEGRVAARLASAAWDRVLRLRPEFFRDYAAGDLAARIAVFRSLRDKVSGTVGGPLLSLIFLTPTFLLVFAYDAALGWISFGLAAVALAAALGFGLYQFPLHQRHLKAVRDLSSELFQFITGIAKLRSGGAEEAAFASWARKYREQQAATLEIAALNAHFVAFSAALPGVVATLLFAYALWPNAGLGVGAFLAAYGVSMTFFAAVSRLGHSFQAVATFAPSMLQVRPLLAETPPPRPDDAPEAVLAGGLAFEHVSFRYTADGPLVVEDVSLHAEPGEFIAIVGETGCGKSTLIRLALGLHDPTEGSVSFDGHDLASLDRRSVRRQVGVVMQNGGLRQGTILQNIVGVSRNVDVAGAWRAARQAAVAADIEAMPMQLFTPVGESDVTYSGGQAQRIMIAAALAREPRIVFLDEATSWLDTGAQSAVMSAIEALTITRVVVAHRLSTIRGADRIYVMHEGRVVQVGGFDELFDKPGRFRELMLRQML